jgi:PilZ domain
MGKVMTQRGYSVHRALPAGDAGLEAGRYCAYNQSRERFLSAEVDAADFSIASLESRLVEIAPGSGRALWLVPFRGLSSTGVRVPIDLVCLDRELQVIDVVESFPLARISPTNQPSASVLALPGGTIRSTETRVGDQLILCPPEEMKQQLLWLASSSADGKPPQAATAAKQEAVRSSGRVLQWEDRFRQDPEQDPVEMAPVEDQGQDAVFAAPSPSLPEDQSQSKIEPTGGQQSSAKPRKSWLQRLLSPDPDQPRKAQRERLPDLAAYFFTGGTPEAHDVRDISQSGLYVLTKERWYLGTLVRMTLTDRTAPTVDRSITLQAAVVRWGNDGVGLKFVLSSSKDRHRDHVGLDRLAMEQFIERLRGAKAS